MSNSIVKFFLTKKKQHWWEDILEVVSPGTYLAIRAGRALLDHLRDQGKITSDDSQNIIEIIKAGQQNKVSEMEIVVRREIVFGIEGRLKDLSKQVPYDFTITVGGRGNTEYHIKVKYK